MIYSREKMECIPYAQQYSIKTNKRLKLGNVNYGTGGILEWYYMKIVHYYENNYSLFYSFITFLFTHIAGRQSANNKSNPLYFKTKSRLLSKYNNSFLFLTKGHICHCGVVSCLCLPIWQPGFDSR